MPQASPRSLCLERFTVYGDGTQLRDVTYVDDVVEGVVRVARQPAQANPAWSRADPDPANSWHPWRLYNIGRGEQVTANRLIELLKTVLDRPGQRVQAPGQTVCGPAAPPGLSLSPYSSWRLSSTCAYTVRR